MKTEKMPTELINGGQSIDAPFSYILEIVDADGEIRFQTESDRDFFHDSIMERHFGNANLIKRKEPIELIMEEYEIAEPDIQFDCKFAIFLKGTDNSICYCTSEERAALIIRALENLNHTDPTKQGE